MLRAVTMPRVAMLSTRRHSRDLPRVEEIGVTQQLLRPRSGIEDAETVVALPAACRILLVLLLRRRQFH